MFDESVTLARHAVEKALSRLCASYSADVIAVTKIAVSDATAFVGFWSGARFGPRSRDVRRPTRPPLHRDEAGEERAAGTRRSGESR